MMIKFSEHSGSFTINLDCSLSNNFKIIANEINFDLGSKVGILGKNGSGKTTFLRLLSERANLNNGRSNFSFIEKIPKEFNHLKCTEFLNTIVGAKGFKNPSLELLEVTGFHELKDEKISYLSTGQLRRFINLLSFLKTQSIVLLDEPFNGVDADYSEKLMNFLNDQSYTVLVAAHQMKVLKNFCSNYLIVKNGAVKKIEEADHANFEREDFKLKFDTKLNGDIKLNFLGEKDGLYEYGFSKIESPEAFRDSFTELLDIIDKNSEHFFEMKKNERVKFQRDIN